MTVVEAIKYLKQLYPNGGHCWLDEQRIEAISMAISALEHEEPVSEDLEEAFNQSFEKVKDETLCVYDYHAGFVDGAQWKEEQMIANTADAMIGLPYENKDGGTCKSCKRRYDDAHLSFPDCWDGHKEENKRRGTGCKYYVFDKNIL